LVAAHLSLAGVVKDVATFWCDWRRRFQYDRRHARWKINK
jgi:hypothetical protein